MEEEASHGLNGEGKDDGEVCVVCGEAEICPLLSKIGIFRAR